MGQFVGSDSFSCPFHKSVQRTRWGPCSLLQRFSFFASFFSLFFIHRHKFLNAYQTLSSFTEQSAEHYCLVGHVREYFRMLMPEDFRWDAGLFCMLKGCLGQTQQHDESLLFLDKQFLGHAVCFTVEAAKKWLKIYDVFGFVWNIFTVPCAPEVLLLPPAAPDPCLCWNKKKKK